MKKARLLLWCGAVVGMSGLVSCVRVDAKTQREVNVTGGDTTYLASPQTAHQCVNIDQESSAKITRDARSSCITGVKLYYEEINCAGASDDPDKETKDRSKYFLGAIGGNVVCEEALHVEKASPCKLYEVYSGGISYKLCYDYASGKAVRVPTSECVYHSGHCR